MKKAAISALVGLLLTAALLAQTQRSSATDLQQRSPLVAVVVPKAPASTKVQRPDTAASSSLECVDRRLVSTSRYVSALDAIYCGLLGRLADADGSAYWESKLEDGSMTLTDVLRLLVGSAEYRNRNSADPFETLGRITRVSSGFRASETISAQAFERWVGNSPLQQQSEVTPSLRHGRLDANNQSVNVAYVHLSATRGIRVSPGGRAASQVGTWASEIGAHVAINGNWFAPWDGPAVSAGRAYAGADHGYTSLFGVTEDGDWIIDHHREVNSAIDDRIVEGVAGHPTLVYRGERTIDFGADPAFLNRHPRTAIGIDRSGDILILVTVDGRRSGILGMTGDETAQLMERLGAHDAVMLDGGGSTTMWIAGEGVVNRPSGGLRAVGNQVAVFGN